MSRAKINKILLVVANPENPQDKRGNLVTELAQAYRSASERAGIEVDFLDLYREGYNPVHYPHRRDTQTIEYQIRLRKADKVVFFHPVWWGGLPGVLKGFLDKVFTVDYAYQKVHGNTEGLLNKPALVFAAGRYPHWKMRYFFNNNLEILWRRIVFDVVGLQGPVVYFGNYREAPETEVNRWFARVTRYASRQNKSGNLFDLV